MKLFHAESNGGFNCEYEMQDALDELLKKRPHHFYYKREVRVKEVGRIADFLIYDSEGRLINIEAKCYGFGKLVEQMKDHKTYCDYNYAFILENAITSKDFKKELLENYFGLLIYNHDTKAITEALGTHKNHKLNRELRDKMIKIILDKTTSI